MRRSLSIGGSSSLQWQKVGRSWRLRMCFRCLLSVRIEIDQLQCVNCWVIIHCLSVSCTKINHSRCALVIWSSLQLTSKQWIITQQFTAGADLFLNSSENNIDCKLLITKTKEQKSNRKINIGVIYIIHCVLSLLMLKNTLLTFRSINWMEVSHIYYGKIKISLITINCLIFFLLLTPSFMCKVQWSTSVKFSC